MPCALKSLSPSKLAMVPSKSMRSSMLLKERRVMRVMMRVMMMRVMMLNMVAPFELRGGGHETFMLPLTI